MPPSTITTSGTQSPLVSSALSYPQNADPTTYLPYSSPQILISSGTWRHPKPGVPLNVTYAIFGGGGGGGTADQGAPLQGAGGGGSGRITFGTATFTKDQSVTIGAAGAATGGLGTTGGTTTFNSVSCAGGSGGGASTGTTGSGGAGGFGGGGGAGNGVTAGDGGQGNDYTGGGGVYSTTTGGAAGNTRAGRQAVSGTTSLADANFPNGATRVGVGGSGGMPSTLFPWALLYGQGGSGGGTQFGGYPTGSVGISGIQGAVFIWYGRP